MPKTTSTSLQLSRGMPSVDIIELIIEEKKVFCRNINCGECVKLTLLMLFSHLGICKVNVLTLKKWWFRMMSGPTKSNGEFIGLIGSGMKYANGRWEITDSFTNDVLAYMNGTSQIPFGLNQWHFPLSKCSDKGKDYRTLSFHKYVEQPGHFCWWNLLHLRKCSRRNPQLCHGRRWRLADGRNAK